jgi:hypothetical protein
MTSTTTGQAEAAIDAARAFRSMGMSHGQAAAAVITAMASAGIELEDGMVATLERAEAPTQAARDYAEMRRITGTRDDEPVPAWY